MIRDFLAGAAYAPRGLRHLTDPGLRAFVWLPLLINVLVFGGLFYLGAIYWADLVAWLLPSTEGLSDAWWGDVLAVLITVLRWLLWPLYVLAAAIVGFYTFTIAATLIGAPFNEFLAQRVEHRETGGRLPPTDADEGLVTTLVTSVGDELRKLVYFAAIAIPLLLLFLVPVVQIIAPFLWAAFGAWSAGLEYLDYPLGNHGIAFKQQRAILRRRRMLVLGFGAAVMAMTVVPVLNLLVMPSAVIGATLLWVERFDAGENTQSS